jgi:hypothetical protein
MICWGEYFNTNQFERPERILDRFGIYPQLGSLCATWYAKLLKVDGEKTKKLY